MRRERRLLQLLAEADIRRGRLGRDELWAALEWRFRGLVGPSRADGDPVLSTAEAAAVAARHVFGAADST